MWKELPEQIQQSLEYSWRNGTPAVATALYARWWQLETWLRSLAYIELRTTYGSEWVEQLSRPSERRQADDGKFSYMATPDAQARLAYADVADVFDTIERNWDLFNAVLLERAVWTGRTVELRSIRNRIGHCRRPHPDDLLRLEQTLRDLECGAFRALASFNRRGAAEELVADPLVTAWVQGSHATAQRLIRHAETQYETSFQLEWSRRPWASLHAIGKLVSGTKGFIWHAKWYMRGRSLNLRTFWQDRALDVFRENILTVCASSPSSLEIAFAAVEDSMICADAIGRCFDLVLFHQQRDPAEMAWDRWRQANADLDPRVHIADPWTVVDDSTTPISIFAA